MGCRHSMNNKLHRYVIICMTLALQNVMWWLCCSLGLKTIKCLTSSGVYQRIISTCWDSPSAASCYQLSFMEVNFYLYRAFQNHTYKELCRFHFKGRRWGGGIRFFLLQLLCVFLFLLPTTCPSTSVHDPLSRSGPRPSVSLCPWTLCQV